ncbi:MAG: ABC transporter ATP-binding protein [bacterium]|nr:ABC transporter ATP-binding protein [bacterium]
MIRVHFHTVTKKFEENIIIDNLSFEINPSERLVIFGPSGCGKSTLLRLIAGFDTPTNGSICLNDVPVSDGSRILVPPDDRNISMVFQDLALWPHLTVKGNLEFSLKARGVSRKERLNRVAEILELVQMREYLNAAAATLSGGQKQRIALARALITRPGLILMDEPLSSLNEDLSLAIQDEILQLHKKLKFTMIYVTHNIREVEKIATRTFHLTRGRLKE